MPRQCTICCHPNRRAIEAALQGKTSLRTVAVGWSVSKTALLRHRKTHLATVPGMPQNAQELQPTTGGPQPRTAPLAPAGGRAAGPTVDVTHVQRQALETYYTAVRYASRA